MFFKAFKILKNRVEEFIGKRIKDIRKNDRLKSKTFKFGGSCSKPKPFCDKADFIHILKTQRIKLLYESKVEDFVDI